MRSVSNARDDRPRRSVAGCGLVLILASCLSVGAVPPADPAPAAPSPAGLYLQVTMGPDHQVPAFIHVFGRLPRAPWSLAHQNITQQGLFAGARGGMIADDAHWLSGGDHSPWLDAAAVLDTNGVNYLQLTAVTDYRALVPAADFTVTFSRTPSPSGLVRQFRRRGPGAGLQLSVDLAHPEQIARDLDWTEAALAAAQALAPARGSRPRLFPIQTGCTVDPRVHESAVIRNELTVLARLGFSGLDPQPLFLEHGFGHPFARVFYWHLRRDHCANNVDPAELRRYLTSQLAPLRATGVDRHLAYVSLMDEPSSPPAQHLAACPHCLKKFRADLQDQGLRPSDFEKAAWDDIRPVDQAGSDAKLFYFSARFRHQTLADYFRLGTSILEELVPGPRTTANFAESLTYYGNLLRRGVDWFLILQTDALTYGWVEDWITHGLTPQLCGYHADFLRAACRARQQPFGMYTVMKRPRDLERKAITEIGHGVRALHYYNYGPTYTGASDADSEKTDKYPFLQRANFAIGAVERYLVNARVPPSRVALHYSHASDIWTAAAPENPHGKERMYLYLLLRHLGYPVEVLTEEEIAAGALRACDFLVVLGPHVQRSAQSAMVDWVNAGGFLYLGPGSGRFDEFNQPADLGQQFGIGRGPFRETQPVGRAEFELAKRTPLDTVRFMDDDLAVLCVRQSLGLSNPPAAEVVARFRDGQPALLVRRAGKGKVAASGFFVGVGYAQGAAAARQARWNHERQTGTERASYAPPSFPSGYRALFATLLRQIDYRPPVRSSEPLVEANLLRAPDADVIALVNWSAQPVTNLAVTVATGSASGQPTAVINQLKATRAAAGETTVVLDLPTIDFLVFPTRPSSPPARDKDR